MISLICNPYMYEYNKDVLKKMTLNVILNVQTAPFCPSAVQNPAE